MKKVLVIAVITACMFNLVSAQEKYKPKSGFSLEVGCAPIAGTISTTQLAGFIHFSDKLALRIGLELNFDGEGADNGKTGNELVKESNSEFGFSLEPGIVYFFKGTPRLAPYIGAGIGLGAKTINSSQKYGDTTNEHNNQKGSYIAFGLGASTGFNYYVAQHLYLGAELGFGLTYKSLLNEEIKEGNNTTKGEGNAHEMGLGINATPMLRLGWTF